MVPLTTVLEELGWDSLAYSEWKTLENIQKLKPFAQYTSLVSGEEYTTASSVIPILMELNIHLEESKKVPELHPVATLLQSEHKRRFKKYTDPGDQDHDPIFLLSTLLDPRYRLLLNPIQTDAAKDELLDYIKDAPVESSNSGNSSTSPVQVEEEEEPCTK